jgi:hypothetical protein
MKNTLLFDAYVFSFSVRGGTDDFKQYVLNDAGYLDEKGRPVTEDCGFKIKSRKTPREIKVTMQNGPQKRVTVHEKQVITWSRKYAEKAHAERSEVIAKAEDLVRSPSKFNKATSYGAAAYVKNIVFDKKTGEIKEQDGKKLSLDREKIEAEEKFDGYYAYVSSELHLTNDEIIDIYRGLWEIEETFKITKSGLDARPVFLHLLDRIDAHFLTCFIALTILRLIQKKLGKEHSIPSIIECLNNIECSHEMENIYLFGYRNQLSDFLGETFGFDFKKKRLRLAEIKKILGDAKR